MSNSNAELFTNALWILMPAIALLAAMTIGMRTERFARAMQDVTKAERILKALGWMLPIVLSAFIVTMLWRIKGSTGFHPGTWSFADVTANANWIALWLAAGTIWTLKPGDVTSPLRLGRRVALVAACVLGLQFLPLAINGVGAPAWTMYAILFCVGVAWLKLAPAGRTPEQHAADERAADEAIARLTPAQRTDIDALLRQGRYIEAVRDLRDILGGDLRIAKYAADRLGSIIETAMHSSDSCSPNKKTPGLSTGRFNSETIRPQATRLARPTRRTGVCTGASMFHPRDDVSAPR